MQIARLGIAPDNKFTAIGSNPTSLAEAKATKDGDELSRTSVEPATKMLQDFRTLASRLAAMDNTEKQAAPKAPAQLKFIEKLIPGRSSAYKEASSNYKAEVNRLKFSNGTDLCTDQGRVITTWDLNQQELNAELRLGPEGLGGSTDGSLPLPMGTYLVADQKLKVVEGRRAVDAESSYSLSSADGRDTYRYEHKYGDGTKKISAQTLTIDWATRTAEYIKE